mgnify:CR=1 FL=1
MKGPLVVFDMDGVLVGPRSSWRIVHEHFGTSNEESFLAYMQGEIDDLEFMRRDIALWKDFMEEPGIGRINDVLDRVEPMKGFHKAMKDLRSAGFSLIIISGGLDLLADRLMELGGFNGSFANGISKGKDGQIDGEGILRVPLRDKGSVMKGLKGYGPIAAVGDSLVDIPMFRKADISIAFRPENEEVASSADHVVDEPDLTIVSDLILREIGAKQQ